MPGNGGPGRTVLDMHPFPRLALAVTATILLTAAWGLIGLVFGVLALVAVVVTVVLQGGDDWTPPRTRDAWKTAEDHDRMAAWTGEATDS